MPLNYHGVDEAVILTVGVLLNFTEEEVIVTVHGALLNNCLFGERHLVVVAIDGQASRSIVIYLQVCIMVVHD